MTRRILITTVLAAFLLIPLASARAAPIHDAARTGDLKALDSLLAVQAQHSHPTAGTGSTL
jgi:hypothetical protein